MQSLTTLCNPLLIHSKTWQQTKRWQLRKHFSKHSYYYNSANTITRTWLVFQQKVKNTLNKKIQFFSHVSLKFSLTDISDFSLGSLTSIKKIKPNSLLSHEYIQLWSACLLIFCTINHFQVVLTFINTIGQILNRSYHSKVKVGKEVWKKKNIDF